MSNDVLRIYAGRVATSSGPRRPGRTSLAPVRALLHRASAATGELPVAAELRAVIERPAGFGESVNEAFDRKEREVAALFRALAVPEARALLSRIAEPVAGDSLADAFARLAAERRRRLVRVLEGVAHAHRGSAA